MTDNEKRTRIRELIEILRPAARAYYQESREIMSNYEYDALYDELAALEKETGMILAGSPTQNVGYEVVSELPKMRHEKPMLSLAKTKSVDELADWLGDQKGLLSWKMDGLTIVLTYRDGALVQAVTRGNGEIGEVITGNAKVFANLPVNIAYQGELILRGEAIIRYSEFEKINAEIGDADAKYKNPRNLCSGSVRQLNSEITAKRNVNFFAFSLVQAEGVDFENSREKQFEWLEGQGFEVVHRVEVTRETIRDAVAEVAKAIEGNDIPSDGLVLLYDDIAYGDSLGRTAKFPRNSIAFKWRDEIGETTLKYIEWSASRTGLINPVAVFEPVELEGTTVSRASVHNVSIVRELGLSAGDRITVYKANMIIPQIQENLTRHGEVEIPAVCPVCGGPTEVRREASASVLFCPNPECPAKKLKNFTLFVSRDALNIDGLSEMTLEKFIGRGFIHTYADLFRLEKHREEIVTMEGFGEKSYENLMSAVKTASETDLYRVIYGLGIEGIGLANAKVLCRYFGDDLEKIRRAGAEELQEIEGIGGVLAASVEKYFRDEEKMRQLDDLLSCLTIRKAESGEESGVPQTMAGKSVVITGSLAHFSNRKELQELIEQAGGRAAGSVSAKTAYLVNNDITSTSGKNKKAKELGVPIVTEDEFLAILRGED